jgi:formylglycine-generating enzyme required for sulfatase activity
MSIFTAVVIAVAVGLWIFIPKDYKPKYTQVEQTIIEDYTKHTKGSKWRQAHKLLKEKGKKFTTQLGKKWYKARFADAKSKYEDLEQRAKERYDEYLKGYRLSKAGDHIRFTKYIAKFKFIHSKYADTDHGDKAGERINEIIFARNKAATQLFAELKKISRDFATQGAYNKAAEHLKKGFPPELHEAPVHKKVKAEIDLLEKKWKDLPQAQKDAVAALDAAREYEKKNPRDYLGLLKNYNDIVKKYPGTYAFTYSHEKVKDIQAVVEKEAKQLAKVKNVKVDEQLDVKKFNDAVKIYDDFPKKLKNSKGWRGILKKIETIKTRANSEYLSDKKRILFLRRKGKIKDAIARISVYAAWDHPILDFITKDGKKVLSGLQLIEPFHSAQRMVLISEGEFVMGCSEHKKYPKRRYKSRDAMPERRLFLSSFYMDIYEVTNGDYKVFVDETGHRPPAHWNGKAPPAGTEKHPVTHVSWNDAKAYAEWCGKRLPTEEEWEKAARGPEGNIFPWGQWWLKDRAHIDGKAPKPIDVYPKGKSVYGCYCMAGNVWEWTNNWYEAYRGNVLRDPKFGETHKVCRGGGFKDPLETGCLGFRRTPKEPEKLYEDVGFRCAKDAE